MIVALPIEPDGASTHCSLTNSTLPNPDIRLDRSSRWYNQSRQPGSVGAAVFLLVDRVFVSFRSLRRGHARQRWHFIGDIHLPQVCRCSSGLAGHSQGSELLVSGHE